MMLNDKKFWIWVGMCAIIPFIMGVFAITALIYPYSDYKYSEFFAELFNSINIKIFIIWEVAYMLAATLSYRKIISRNWGLSALICWGIGCPIIVVSSFIFASIEIHDGYEGLAYIMITCISWGFSLSPLLLVSYIFKSFQQQPGA